MLKNIYKIYQKLIALNIKTLKINKKDNFIINYLK